MIKRICVTSLAIVVMGTAVAVADENIDFGKQIQPIFLENCEKCHGAEKASGGLRLHSVEEIQKKWTAQPELLVAGDPEKSELYQRLVLPADNAKRMPKKADPLPKEKIELIAKWIREGATLPAAVVANEPTATTTNKPESPALPEISPAPKNAIDKLTAGGAKVMLLNSGGSLLCVSFAHRNPPVGDAEMALLADVAEQVDTLDLAGSKATAAGLATLAGLKNLSELHLENSSVTDEGLANLAELKNLQYLNLYDTGITDVGLKRLGDLKHLRKLYLWQTKVSFDAAMKLENDTPGLIVDLGYNHPMAAKMRLTKALETAKEQAEKAKAEQAKVEQQLENAKKSVEMATARIAEVEKELKSLEAEIAADNAKSAAPQADQETKK